MYNLFDQYAVDYLDSMLSPIDNYISRETEVFLNMKIDGTPYLELLFRMANKVFERKESGGMDRATASKIFESLFLNCRGRVDGSLAPAMKMILGALSKMNEPVSQSHVLRVVASMLYYNPAQCLQVIESMSATSQLFQLLFRLLKDEKNCFKSLLDKKIVSLGLSSVIALPLNQLPISVRNVYASFVGECVKILSRLHQHRQAIAQREEKEDDDEDAESDDGGVEIESRQYDENEDAVTEEDQAYMKFLKDIQDQGYLEDQEDEEEREDDPDHPVGHIEPFVFFHDALRAQDARVVKQAENSLPPPMRQVLQQVVAFAASVRTN